VGLCFDLTGIVPDIRQNETDDTNPISPTAYVAYPFGITPNTGLTVRVSGDPLTIAAPLRAAIRDADSALAVFQMRSMEELKTRGYWEYFLFGWMFSLFGGIALLLAAIGVYGVLSYAVEQRTQEIGIRVALGASRGNVLTLVVSQGVGLDSVGVVVVVCAADRSRRRRLLLSVRLIRTSPSHPYYQGDHRDLHQADGGNLLTLFVSQGVRLLLVGVVIGIVGSWFVMPVIESQLVKVSPKDPASFIGVSIFLTAIACVASYVPARRATAVDPIVALRAE
jgi:hypothetical protein